MLKLLTNSLTREFYQQHAGFFLFGLYILFGVVDPSKLLEYHKALLLAGISSPLGILLVSISWFLYATKAHFFMKQRLGLPQYNFIKEISSQKKDIQLKLWLKFYLVILFPVLIYVILLIGFSLKHQFYITATGIIIIFAVLLFGLVWLRFRAITFGFLKHEQQLMNIRFKIKRPFFSWPVFYLFNEQPLMLLMCKIMSLILFKSILWMFADIENDVRVLLTALLASVLCHSVLVFNLLKFETEYLSFSKSLPFKVSKKIWNWLLVFAIILIPEWVFLIMAAHYNLYSIVSGLLFGLAALFFLLTLLYIVKLNMESYLKGLLFFFFITMWAVLGHYYILFSLFLISCAVVFHIFRFNKTEWN